MVLAGRELEDRRAAVEVVADDEPRLFELGEHPIHGCKADRLTGREEGAVHVLRADVQIGALFENLEYAKAGKGRFEPCAPEVGILHEPCSPKRESQWRRVTPEGGDRKSEMRLRM